MLPVTPRLIFPMGTTQCSDYIVPIGQMFLFIKIPWAVPKAELYCAFSALHQTFNVMFLRGNSAATTKIYVEPIILKIF